MHRDGKKGTQRWMKKGMYMEMHKEGTCTEERYTEMNGVRDVQGDG